MAGLSPTMADAVEAAAAEWMWETTLRRYGNCAVGFRPCVRRCNTMGGSALLGGGSPWFPVRESGGWYNIACGRCGDQCSCTWLSEIILPTVGTVHEVSMFGEALPSDTWRVDNMRRLVRVDGGRWPSCQDMTADPPAWQVTYTPGYAVPTQGRMAYGMLVCQMARLACGEKCQLPAGVTTVTRQGVTINISPAQDAVTGLWMVDAWVAMVNRPQARVWSPDMQVTRTVPVNV